MKSIKLFLILLFTTGLLLAGCGGITPQVDPGLALTHAVETVDAIVQQTSTAMALAQPTNTPEPPPTDMPTATNTLAPVESPTNTLNPTQQLTPLATNTPLPPANTQPANTQPATTTCNMAAFISDVTIPDNTEMSPGKTFTKTWRLKNIGTCTWNKNYKLVFVSGDQMGGLDSVAFTTKNISPGESVDVSVDLKAPNNAGTFTGYWKLRSDEKVTFGLGTNQGAFYVLIKVVQAADINYTLTVSNTHVCSGKTWVALAVKNTGANFLQSMTAGVVRDLTDNVQFDTIAASDKPFYDDAHACGSPNVTDADPGETYFIMVNMGANPPKHNYRFNITLCTKDGGAGQCLNKTVEYKLQ